jgi:hypothetical protein
MINGTPQFAFLWYKTYIFTFAKGQKTKLRIKYMNGPQLSLRQHLWALFKTRVFRHSIKI